MELTKTQQEVLQMLRNGYTAKKIALTRGISERRVYVIKAKLRELGMWKLNKKQRQMNLHHGTRTIGSGYTLH